MAISKTTLWVVKYDYHILHNLTFLLHPQVEYESMCGYDALHILGSLLCGSIPPDTVYYYNISEMYTITLKFETDSSVTDVGFELYYSFKWLNNAIDKVAWSNKIFPA